MIPVLSRAQMAAYDAHAIEVCNVPGLVLMENAGRGAADVIQRELLGGDPRTRRVVVVCGTGNNGGDGFVVARHMLGRGSRVQAWLAGEVAGATTDCHTHHDAFVGVGGTVETIPLGESLEGLAAALTHADVVVDALFGTGLSRAIESPLLDVVRLLNAARDADTALRVAALDVPSGLNADTGVAMGLAVRSDLTVSFAHLKLGHTTGHGARICGPVHVVDIGVPAAVLGDETVALVEADDVRALIAKRPLDTHKYRVGHVAVVAGSPGKVGAALLTAQGALRGGAGAATIITWAEAAAALEARVVETMVAPLPALTETGGDIAALERAIDAALRGKRTVVIGPGFGTGDASRLVSQRILDTFPGTIVGDADVLSLHARSPQDFAIAAGRVVLTPHAGELARLLGRTSEEIEADRFAAAREGAEKTESVVLLKGAYTIVASPDRRVVVTGSGVPALATAGSGDVLAGLVAALACTLPPFEAAWCGAFLHGVSGSAWQKEHGDRGLVASEIANGLPDVLSALLG